MKSGVTLSEGGVCMKLRLRVSREKQQLLVRIDHIPMQKIMENSKGYYFDLSLEKIQLSGEISSVYAREMEYGKVRLNLFTLQKSDHDTFTVRFVLNLHEVFCGIQNNRVQLFIDQHEGVQLKGFLSIRKEQLEPYIEQMECEKAPSIVDDRLKKVASTNLPPLQNKKWHNIRWKNDRKRTYGALFYKFNKSMNRYAEKQKQFGGSRNLKVDPIALRRKGIYHDEFGDNRCDNCYYFRGDLCSLHLVTVAVDYSCFKHRGFREIQGGAFSPK